MIALFSFSSSSFVNCCSLFVHIMELDEKIGLELYCSSSLQNFFEDLCHMSQFFSLSLLFPSYIACIVVENMNCNDELWMEDLLRVAKLAGYFFRLCWLQDKKENLQNFIQFLRKKINYVIFFVRQGLG